VSPQPPEEAVEVAAVVVDRLFCPEGMTREDVEAAAAKILTPAYTAMARQYSQEVRERLMEQAAEYRREADEADLKGMKALVTAAQAIECATRIVFDSGPKEDD